MSISGNSRSGEGVASVTLNNVTNSHSGIIIKMSAGIPNVSEQFLNTSSKFYMTLENPSFVSGQNVNTPKVTGVDIVVARLCRVVCCWLFCDAGSCDGGSDDGDDCYESTD